MVQITVYHLENSRSFRIIWLLEELGAEYSIKTFPRNPKTLLAPPELKEIHPLGKSPVVEVIDNDGDRVVLAESGAIIAQLIELIGNGRFGAPAGNKQARADYNFWLHAAEGSIMIYLIGRMYATRIAGPDEPKIDAVFGPNLKKHFDFIESTLSQHTFFVGDELTGADIAMVYPMLSAPLATYPNSKAWLDRVRQRPAYRKAEEKTEPVDMAKFLSPRRAKS